jgi:hypothetical protein
VGFPHFAKSILEKKIHQKILFFSKRICHKKKEIKNHSKFIPTAHNMRERVLQVFLLFYIEYCQIWLNTLIDDCHLATSENWGNFF